MTTILMASFLLIEVRLESSSTGSSFPADFAKPVPLAVVSLDSSRIPGVRASSESDVYCRPKRLPVYRTPERSHHRPQADTGTGPTTSDESNITSPSRVHHLLLITARTTHPSEPILIPKQAVFMDSIPYREKITLPRTIADVSEFDSVTALVPESTSSASQFGNIDPIPFRKISLTVSTDFSASLGPTEPCPTAVHMEPFSTLVLKILT
ncbi:hypothetical protein SSS_08937 [Sarcoptes scabiei]|uniref:Uncharacterized protein n=1 Tax=Sarcoptes scabiei TaxID=52283 RepID=A0A834RJK6_SARSC|nr:hypothetical protein SSS_08393 [Sarcoptes scabiei]KAF7495158.1 hypothetical protein SSS_08937 [Sarcoptes scabiei]